MALAERPTMRLQPLARSLPITALALAGICNCGCSLPQVQPRLAADFAAGTTAVRRIAVLPIDFDVQVAGQPPGSAPVAALDRQTVDRLHRGLAAALARRGYQVTAVVEPNGTSADPRGGGWSMVLHPRDLAALRVEIHQRTAIVAGGPGLLETRVSADLTRYLGKTTGADATLYARGWAHVGPEGNAGADVAKVLLGVLMVVLIVGLVFALFASKGKGKAPRLGGGRSGGAHRAHGRAFTMRPAGRVLLRTAAHVALAASLETRHRTHCHRCPPPPPPLPPPDSLEAPLPPTSEPGVEAVPAPPASGPAPEAVPAPPLPEQVAPLEEPPPVLYLRNGEPPTGHEVGLAISLLHNQSGRVLWHAAQRFNVKAGAADLEGLVEHFLKQLPSAR